MSADMTTAPRRAAGWLDLLVSPGLSGIYLTVLLLTVDSLGYARDEGFYFQAADSYARWFQLLLEDPTRAMDLKTVDKYWRVNHEHPALVKSLFALSHQLLYERWHLFSLEGTAYRFPGMVFSACAVGLTYLWGTQAVSRFAGVVAALTFAAMPRVFYHAHLDCFDMPVVAMWLITAYAYWRCQAQHSVGWAITTAVLFGLMLNTKHNSWLFPFVIVAHLVLSRGAGFLAALRGARRAPLLALVLMATLSPLLFYATWPWIWHDTLPRLREYVQFHTGHVYYNMEFLGRTYWDAPMPRLYAWVMTAATVPLVTLLLAVVGLTLALRGAYLAPLRARLLDRRGALHVAGSFLLPQSATTATAQLWALSIAASYAPWLSTATPIFGGTKHWLTAYPFLSLFAGFAAAHLADTLRASWQRVISAQPRLGRMSPGMIPPLLGVCITAGPILMTAGSHPWGLSAYTPIVGGAPGAATLGLNRTYWGYTTGALQGWLAEHATAQDRVYVHDTALQSWDMMATEGRFGEPLRGSLNIVGSQFALYHHEPHMSRVEHQIWDVYGTTTPAMLGTHDGVPVVWLYQVPEPR